MKIKNGVKIKDFPLISTDEKKSKLKDYLDKNLILYFIRKISLQDVLQKV